jgi:anthranilate synthase component 1
LKVYSQTFLYDCISPIGVLQVLKNNFKNDLVHLFESVITKESSSSIITIGTRESIISRDFKSYHIDENNTKKEIQENPLLFMKEYFNTFDKEYFKNKSMQLNVKFLDGFIGFIGYDMAGYFTPKLKKTFENLVDEIGSEDFYYIRPEIIITINHLTSTIILTSTDSKYVSKLDEVKELLLCCDIKHKEIKNDANIYDITHKFSQEEYMDIVNQAQEYIKSGDVFQILPSNRITIKTDINHMDFYRTLRSINPSEYMFYLDFDKYSIIGSSPEKLVSLEDNVTTLNPIAGTRKRGKSREKDIFYEEELQNDPKERAEHIMLVDLGRNDLGKVSLAGSVKLNKFMKVQKYSHVMHLVSTLNSVIDDKYDMFDLVMAVFTAGTMTGTPKIRAMQLISEFEKIKRNFYSGAVGYFGFDGNMNSAIAIRSAYLDDEKIILQSGAGVVADSVAKLEYDEVNNKLQALVTVIKNLSNTK